LPYSKRLSADLDAALLGRTDLSHAQPINAYLDSADLSGAKLRGADLYYSCLSGADLGSAPSMGGVEWNCFLRL
jgi:uncharacterized protein YjbI with pentapeptide repeats